jgi:hypothetical protein
MAILNKIKVGDTNYDIAAKDANLDWGGRSITGGISPIGASLSAEHSANRLAYLDPAALVFEASDNAGSS